MANFGAQIAGPWAQDADGNNAPAIQDVWSIAGFGWENLQDVTAQHAPAIRTLAPNLCVWQVDVVDELALDLLDADPRFYVLSEWEVESDGPRARAAVRPEKPKDERPGQPEWIALRNWLRGQGISNRELKEMLADNVRGRPRRQIFRRLRLWLWSAGMTSNDVIGTNADVLVGAQHAFGLFGVKDPDMTREFIAARTKTQRDLRDAIRSRLAEIDDL